MARTDSPIGPPASEEFNGFLAARLPPVRILVISSCRVVPSEGLEVFLAAESLLSRNSSPGRAPPPSAVTLFCAGETM